MRILKNMSIRYKIMIPLITLAVIIWLLGTVNYFGLTSIMEASTAISGNYARCLDMVGDFNADFQHMTRIAYNHIIADNELIYSDLEQEAKAVYDNIQSTQEQFVQLLDSGTNEEKLYEQFMQAFAAFQKNFQELMQLSAMGDNEGATEIANGALASDMDVVEECLSQLRDYEMSAVLSAVAVNEGAYQSAVIRGVAFMVFGLLMTLGSIVLCNIEIVAPVLKMNRELTGIVEEINSARGDLTRTQNRFGASVLQLMRAPMR